MPGGDTNLQDALKLHAIDTQMTVVEAERSAFLTEEVYNRNSGEQIGTVVGNADTDNTHSEDDNGNKSHNGIDDTAYKKDIERTARVALTAEN